MLLCAPGQENDMVQKNRNVITGKFVTASHAKKTPPYDNHGVPKSIHTAQESDPTVRETPQIIQKEERPVQLDGSVTTKCPHAAP